MNSEVSAAWQQAATDLAIRVQAPYSLIVKDGPPIQFEALIRDFGGLQGALVTTIDETGKCAAATEAGFFCSKLNPDSYRSYAPALFRDTLNDWGWFGDRASVPAWYTGSPWS